MVGIIYGEYGRLCYSEKKSDQQDGTYRICLLRRILFSEAMPWRSHCSLPSQPAKAGADSRNTIIIPVLDCVVFSCSLMTIKSFTLLSATMTLGSFATPAFQQQQFTQATEFHELGTQM